MGPRRSFTMWMCTCIVFFMYFSALNNTIMTGIKQRNKRECELGGSLFQPIFQTCKNFDRPFSAGQDTRANSELALYLFEKKIDMLLPASPYGVALRSISYFLMLGFPRCLALFLQVYCLHGLVIFPAPKAPIQKSSKNSSE